MRARVMLVAIGLLGCTTVVVLAEAMARLWFPEWGPTRAERARFWVDDAKLGWAHAPGTRGRFNHPDFSVEVAINADGLRDDEYPKARTSDRRMLVLGDSYAWGFGVEARERFTERLEQRHPDWEIINAAVSGYGIGQEYLYLRGRGLAFRPDVVLMLVCDNDFTDSVRAEDNWRFRPYFELQGGELQVRGVPVPGATLDQLGRRFLLGQTHLGSRIYGAKEAIKRMLHPAARAAPSWAAPPPPIPSTAIAITEALLRAIGSDVDGARAGLVIVSVPMAKDLRAVFERSAHALQAPFLALDPFFAGDARKLLFEHDNHWNAAGQLRAADAIDQFLQDEGVWATPH